MFRDKPRLSRNGQSNQGVAIQLGFSSKTICSFENRLIGCIYKTGTKYASKDEIELAVFKAELLLAVLVLGFRLVVLLCVLRLAVLSTKLLDVLLLGHSVSYGRERHNDKQTQTSTNIK